MGQGRRVVMATMGSLGDLHPFIAVALSLKARGHRPVILAAEALRARVEGAGVEFGAMRPGPEDIERDLGLDEIESARRTLAREDFAMRRLILPYLRASHADAAPYVAEADLVVVNNLAFGAKLAAEAQGVPSILLALQPALFLSAYDPPALGPAPWLPALRERFGPKASGLALELLKRACAVAGGPVRKFRAELGLPPSDAHPLFESTFSDSGTIALYSPVLGGPQPDFPPRTEVVGFTFYDSETGGAPRLPAGLEEFLQSGPAPIVFTLGSLAVNSPGRFFHAAVEASRRLGRRAVLLAGPYGRDPQSRRAGDDVFVTTYAPHSLLFPRAELVVHHGGVGTTAQALRSGRPQLVTPCMADQYDNAVRVERLGLGLALPRSRFSADRAERALRWVLGSPQTARRALRIGRIVAREDGAAVAASIIERLLGSERRAA